MGIPRARRTFTREFKLQVVRALHTGEQRLAQVCREHQLAESVVRRWSAQYEQHGEAAWLDRPGAGTEGPEGTDAERVRELEAALGRAHLEIELLRRALKHAEKGALLRSRNER